MFLFFLLFILRFVKEITGYTNMRGIFLSCVFAGILFHVLAAPSNRFPKSEGDSVEQELIRNHHSAARERLKSSVHQASSEAEESSPVESIEVEETKDNDDRSITEDDLYDITVGDVIRDVLLTLRDHPEIVKELIASEKAKLAEQIDAFNSLVDGDSTGDNLAGYMKPAEQLKSVPNSVEKKTGRSGMAVVPGQSEERKRADEVVNEEYTSGIDTAESQQYNDFMQQPREGGHDDPMFDYEKSITDGSESKELSSTSKVSNSGNGHVRVQDTSQGEGTLKSGPHDTQADDTEAKENEDSEDLDSEEELAWLLHMGHSNNLPGHTKIEASDNGSRYNKM